MFVATLPRALPQTVPTLAGEETLLQQTLHRLQIAGGTIAGIDVTAHAGCWGTSPPRPSTAMSYAVLFWPTTRMTPCGSRVGASWPVGIDVLIIAEMVEARVDLMRLTGPSFQTLIPIHELPPLVNSGCAEGLTTKEPVDSVAMVFACERGTNGMA